MKETGGSEEKQVLPTQGGWVFKKSAKVFFLGSLRYLVFVDSYHWWSTNFLLFFWE